MVSPTSSPASLSAAAARLRERHDGLLAAWLTCVGLPGVRAADAVGRDVAEALGRSLAALAAALEDPGQDDRAALGFLRAHIRRTVLRGVRGPSLLRWCHQLERLVWDELRGAAASPDDLLPATRRVMEFVEALNEVCAAAYEETETAIAESGDIVRSRLVQSLVLGEDLRATVVRQAAEACGLDAGRPLAVVVLRGAVPFTDQGQTAVAIAALAAAAPGGTAPAAVLDGVVVAVVALEDDQLPAFTNGVRGAQRRLAARELDVRAGLSVGHEDRRHAPEAYREALLALELATAAGPVVALAELRALDYLVLRAGDRTAWKLVRPGVRRLLADPGEEAAALVATLQALFAGDGNVRSAAQRLGVHPNTVHGRLAKVRELTGLEPRHLEDLTELVLAARLARARR